MNASQLRPGLYQVSIPEALGGASFNLSVVEGTGLIGVAAYPDGAMPPRRGKHMLLTESVRAWIDEMTETKR